MQIAANAIEFVCSHVYNLNQVSKIPIGTGKLRFVSRTVTGRTVIPQMTNVSLKQRGCACATMVLSKKGLIKKLTVSQRPPVSPKNAKRSLKRSVYANPNASTTVDQLGTQVNYYENNKKFSINFFLRSRTTMLRLGIR